MPNGHEGRSNGKGGGGRVLAVVLAVIALLGLIAYVVYDCKDATKAKTDHTALVEVVKTNAEVLGTKATTADLGDLAQVVTDNKSATDIALLGRPTKEEMEKSPIASSKRVAAEFRKELHKKADNAKVKKLATAVNANASSLQELNGSAGELDERLSVAESDLDVAQQENEKLRKELKYTKRKARKALKEAKIARGMAADVNAAAVLAKNVTPAPLTPDPLAEEERPRVHVTLRVGNVPTAEE